MDKRLSCFALAFSLFCTASAQAQDGARIGARFDAELWYAPVLMRLLPERSPPVPMGSEEAPYIGALLDLALSGEIAVGSISAGGGVHAAFNPLVYAFSPFCYLESRSSLWSLSLRFDTGLGGFSGPFVFLNWLFGFETDEDDLNPLFLPMLHPALSLRLGYALNENTELMAGVGALCIFLEESVMAAGSAFLGLRFSTSGARRR